MSKLTEHIRAICESIAENLKKVYDLGLEHGKNLGGYSEGFEAGKKSQYDEFWDNGVSEYGWVYKFSGSMWNDKTFYPNQDLKPTGNAHTMFALCRITDLAGRLNECGKKLDMSGVKGTSNSLFSWCALIEHIPYLDLSNSTSGLYNTFEECQKLHTIDGIKLKADGSHPISRAFINCVALENLTIDGTIGQNGFNVQWSIKLSKASWISIMTAASTTANITITGSLVSVNKAFETSPGANDGSTSPEWLALKAARPTVSVSLI
jgi:hypothetical protein